MNFIFWKGFSKNLKVFVSKKCYINHTYLYIFNSINNVLYFLKNKLNGFFLSLIDITGLDISNLTNYNFFFVFKNNKLRTPLDYLIQYNFINYKNSQRFLINFFLTRKHKLFSLETFFLNSNWLERELSEFFNIIFSKKNDTRNLLLDYNFTFNPLLKSFPTEGYEELYFSFENYSLSYVQNEFVEL